MIKIYVRSYSESVDMDAYRETSAHSYCFPGTWEGLVKGLGSSFKGRILPPEDFQALELLEPLVKESGEEVELLDTSRTIDLLKALARGIWKTPTAIVQGKKYEGIEKIRQYLDETSAHTMK
jgi:hypothetical protein